MSSDDTYVIHTLFSGNHCGPCIYFETSGSFGITCGNALAIDFVASKIWFIWLRQKRFLNHVKNVSTSCLSGSDKSASTTVRRNIYIN